MTVRFLSSYYTQQFLQHNYSLTLQFTNIRFYFLFLEDLMMMRIFQSFILSKMLFKKL